MGRRENTFRIDFANVPKKPEYAKVQKFCATVLGLKQGEVLRIQNSRTYGCAFVKVCDLALAQRVCEEHDNKHETTVDGKKYPLRITMEDGAVEVRLFDLSEEVSDQQIVDFLGMYGCVISVREQMCGTEFDFPGISTGVRVAKMLVEQNIESWVTIDGEITQVSYYGQRQTCRHCREYVHIGATCVQNKKLLVQKSYADAAKQTIPKPSILRRPSVYKPRPVSSKSGESGKMLPPPPKPNLQRPKQMPTPPPVLTENNFPTLPSTSGSTAPSDSGSMTSTTGHQPPASGDVVCKTASGKSDGNETDSSVASTNSKRSLRGRPPGKKQRVEDGDDERDESDQP